MTIFWRLWEQAAVSLSHNGSYLIVMGTASVLTFVKSIILAVVLSPPEFGLFVSIVAISVLTSSVISFGRVEGFMKSLPRRWETGDSLSVFKMADDAMRVLSWRTLAVGVPVSIIAGFTQGIGLEVLFISFISLAYSCFNIYSSAIRATSNQMDLAKGTVARASLALIVSSVGGLLYGWKLAIVGEFFGALLAAVLVRYWLHKTKPRSKSENEIHSGNPSTAQDGIFVFLALALVAGPLSLDRIFVTSTFGSEMGGKYGFLLIAGLFCSTMVGIMAQKIGPRLVLQQHAGRPIKEQLLTILKTSVLCIAVSVMAIVFFILCITVWPLASLWQKYSLDMMSVILVSIISFFRISEFFDWLLISHNAEKEMLYSSLIFAVISVVAFAVIYAFSLPFLYFLGSILFSRMAQFAAQISFVLIKSRKLMSGR